jgi:hypothetical protein
MHLISCPNVLVSCRLSLFCSALCGTILRTLLGLYHLPIFLSISYPFSMTYVYPEHTHTHTHLPCLLVQTTESNSTRLTLPFIQRFQPDETQQHTFIITLHLVVNTSIISIHTALDLLHIHCNNWEHRPSPLLRLQCRRKQGKHTGKQPLQI